MRSIVVVFIAVLLAQHFCLQQAVEGFEVEELAAEAGVEALNIGVQPKASQLDGVTNRLIICNG